MFTPGFQFDSREFGEAVSLVIRNTGRAARDVINKASLHVIIGGGTFQGAMQLTPKASKATINSLSNEVVSGYIANKLRAAGTLKSTPKGEFQELVAKEKKRRIRAIGYTAYAGWNNAAKAFGGRGLKGVTASEKKESRHGYGEKARSTISPESTLVNTAPMAEEIGFEPLQKAITNVARDMEEHQLNKMADAIFKEVTPHL